MGEKGLDFIVLLNWVKAVKSYSQHNIKVLNGLIWFNPNIKNNNT